MGVRCIAAAGWTRGAYYTHRLSRETHAQYEWSVRKHTREVKANDLRPKAAAMRCNRIWILLFLSAAALVALAAGDGKESRKLTKGQQEAFLKAFEFNKIPDRKDRKNVEIPEFLVSGNFTAIVVSNLMLYIFPLPDRAIQASDRAGCRHDQLP